MDYSYKIHNGEEIWIERYWGDDEIVSVPASIENMPVKTICEHAFAATDVLEIHVAEGIETIDSEAFAMCESLIRVVLPFSLKKLGKRVFHGSTELAQISFPNGNEVFSVVDSVLYNTAEQSIVLLPPGLKSETFSVPMGIRVIASGAFYQNSSLKHVKLPLTLEKIEAESFLFTKQLRFIELPPHLIEIEPGSFLVGQGMFAEKAFEIYAFPDSIGYRYAVENHIPVHDLYAIITD